MKEKRRKIISNIFSSTSPLLCLKEIKWCWKVMTFYVHKRKLFLLFVDYSSLSLHVEKSTPFYIYIRTSSNHQVKQREREKTRAYFRKVTITSRRIRMLNGIERIYKNTKFSFFFFLASIFLSHLSNYAVFFHSSISLTRWTNITFALNLIYLQRRKK